MRFRPLGDRVVVRRVKEEQKSAAASSSPKLPRKAAGRRDHCGGSRCTR